MWSRVLAIWREIARQPAEQQAVQTMAAALADGISDDLPERLGDAWDWLLINRKLSLSAARELRPLITRLCGGDPQRVAARLLRTGLAASVIDGHPKGVLVPDAIVERCRALAEGLHSEPAGWHCSGAWPIPIHRHFIPLPRADLLLVHAVHSETGPLLGGHHLDGPQLPASLFGRFRRLTPPGLDFAGCLRLGRRLPLHAMAAASGWEPCPVRALMRVVSYCAWRSRCDDLRQYGSWNGFVQHGHFMTQCFASGSDTLLKRGWLAVTASALGGDPGRVPLDETAVLPCEERLMASAGHRSGTALFRGSSHPAYRIETGSLPTLAWIEERSVHDALIVADWQAA
jgi:hypothetical protein